MRPSDYLRLEEDSDYGEEDESDYGVLISHHEEPVSLAYKSGPEFDVKLAPYLETGAQAPIPTSGNPGKTIPRPNTKRDSVARLMVSDEDPVKAALEAIARQSSENKAPLIDIGAMQPIPTRGSDPNKGGRGHIDPDRSTNAYYDRISRRSLFAV